MDETDLPIDIILDRLSVVSQTGSTWSARCPHHHDSNPSLSLTVTPREVVLLHCHRDCTPEEVLGAIDLNLRDLYPSPYALRHGKRRGTYTTGLYTPDAAPEPPIDYTRMTEFHQASLPGKGLAPLAKEWGLPLAAVKRLEIGTHCGKWVIPERNGGGGIVGIVFRKPDGSKRCLTGSHRGLIIPTDTMPVEGQPLYLAEGASDTAALVSVGATVVGRPAASLSEKAFWWLSHLICMRRFDDLVVLADRDQAGEAGAAALASKLKTNHPKWRVRLAKPLFIYKDARSQVVAGRWHAGLVEKEVMQ
ncbi:MAG: hypothetical protein C0467_21950 [Planctomycetaceae bacterium]|nr:hypothetical protein [Planctomycetaceae bacterium]